MSILNQANQSNENITNTNTMLNISELAYTIDSLHQNYNKDVVSFTENIYQRTGITTTIQLQSNVKKTEISPDLLSLYSTFEQQKILEMAQNSINSIAFSIDSSKDDLTLKRKNINNHWLALYDKFVIAYACLLMFFIGAPLGAIIRKGGLGLPIVFAVLIFITFHFINTFGKRISQEDGLSPFVGAWLSSFILTPLAILLTYRATNDIGLINMNVLLLPFQKALKKLFPSQK